MKAYIVSGIAKPLYNIQACMRSGNLYLWPSHSSLVKIHVLHDMQVDLLKSSTLPVCSNSKAHN